MTGRTKLRDVERKSLEQEWRRNRQKHQKRLKEQYGPDFQGVNKLGEVIRRGKRLPPPFRGRELVRDLQRVFNAIGHPVLDEAIRVVRAYGLDKGGATALVKASRDIYGDYEAGLLDHVRWYVEQQGFSVRRAVDKVVTDFGVPASFDAAVEKLRKAYTLRKRS